MCALYTIYTTFCIALLLTLLAIQIRQIQKNLPKKFIVTKNIKLFNEKIAKMLNFTIKRFGIKIGASRVKEKT
jgi:hypothetical protein